MEDPELISKLSRLKEIKPREEWVILTRRRIVELKDSREAFSLQNGRFWDIVGGIGGFMAKYLERPAFVIPVLACMVAGGALWKGASESLPGDTLYPLRAAVEQVPLRLSTEEKRPFRELALAKQRLADLKVAAEQNKVKNLPSAIQEFEVNVSKISEGFLSIVENQPENALQASLGIVQLQKEKSEVEKILGTSIGEEEDQELENATRRLVEYEFVDLESRSLDESQKILLENARKAAQEGDYETALENIWMISRALNQEG